MRSGGIVKSPQSAPFINYDITVKPLLRPNVQAEGAVTGLTVRIPPEALPCAAKIFQSTGTTPAGTGNMSGKVQESSDGSNWSDLACFTKTSGNDNYEQKDVTLTKTYLKYLGTAAGNGTSTIPVSAGLIL